MKTKHPEEDLQIACLFWFKTQHRKYERLIFAIPNGGKRNIIEAARMKKTGTLAGIPDLMLAMANSKHYGLFIEMKAPGGKLSPEQKIQIHILQGENYQAEVCYSVEQFMNIINDYIKDYEND